MEILGFKGSQKGKEKAAGRKLRAGEGGVEGNFKGRGRGKNVC